MGILIIIILIILVIIIASGWISQSNLFKRLVVKMDESEAGIDVALTRRYDTLVKLRDVVKSYAKYESETLLNIVNMRQGMSIQGKNEANRQMDELQSRLNVIAEQYPQLRSAENFMQLQNSIHDVEEHLQAARRIYNVNVSNYNQSIAVFPGSIIAGNQKLLPAHFSRQKNTKSMM